MKKLKLKLVGIIMALLIVTFIIPTQVLATSEDTKNNDLQLVKTAEGDYIIYVKGVTGEFKYALADADNITDELSLNYINSEKDDNGNGDNNVALISAGDVNTSKYIYIKKDANVTIKLLNFDDAFDKVAMEKVETTTKRIPTEIVTVEKNEEVNGVKVKVTVGGLKITDSTTDQYTYSATKLPAEKYSKLMELAKKINDEYNAMDMYNKIEIAKEFYNLYNELINLQTWAPVENMTIMQPNDAKKGEEYVVFLKKVDEAGNEITDVKLMISYREDEEEKIPGRTEVKTVKETAKLPITGESIALFVVLAVIIFVAIIVFVRIKKLQGNQSKH